MLPGLSPETVNPPAGGKCRTGWFISKVSRTKSMHVYLRKSDIEKIAHGPALFLLGRINAWEETFWNGKGSEYSDFVSEEGKRDISALLFLGECSIADETFWYLTGQVLGKRNPLLALKPALAPKDLFRESEEELRKTLESNPSYLFDGRPMLEKYLCRYEEQFSLFIPEILSNAEKEKAQIEEKFFAGKKLGKLISLSADGADRHLGGKTVCVLGFEAGKLVYKPRNLSLDALVKELADEWIPGTVLIPEILTSDDHAFEEFVDVYTARGEEEAEKFYYNLGSTCTLLHVLGATDFHKENILPSGVRPALFDLETVITPRLYSRDFLFGRLRDCQEQNDIFEDITNSLVASLILPFYAENNQEYSVLLSKDEPYSCGPVVGGVQQDVRPYFEHFRNGFTDAYKKAMEMKDTLSAFADRFSPCSVRLLFRATNAYAKILRKSYIPEYLASEESARSSYNQLLALDQNSAITDAEISSLQNGDIPFFNTFGGSKSLFSGTKSVVEDYFYLSPVENAKRRISRLSLSELDFELSLINRSLDCAAGPAVSEKKIAREAPVSITEDEYALEIKQLFESVYAASLEGPSGQSGWIAAKGEIRRADLLRPVMIGGTGGIAAFSSVYGSVCGGTRAAELTAPFTEDMRRLAGNMATLTSLSETGIPLGLDGIAGCLRCLFIISESLNSHEHREIALEMARHLGHISFDDTPYTDFYSGTAGLLYVMCTEKGLEELPDRKRIIENLARQLLGSATVEHNGFRTWDTLGLGRALSGLAHGAAGIGLALLAADGILHDTRLRSAGMEAFSLEHSLYSEKLGTWPDFRKVSVATEYMHGICSGAPGMGMAYLELYRMGIHDFDEDLERAVSAVVKKEMLHRDHFCCGNSGVIAFLQHASEVLSREDLALEAEKRAGLMIAARKLNGDYTYSPKELRNSFEPSLFHGASGVAYTLLHLMRPGTPPILF